MATNYLCIHGHFYQPPREDPLTGEIPLEPGAVPYRNWNERIHDHCYKPNAELRNFERLSFNIGPTLIKWMQEYDPDTLKLITEQDRANVERHGVGNAMAQAYNHAIMPLQNRTTKLTQVRWGMADFAHHFGHAPAGMWLPEAGVDSETLDVLAECGIQYTILAPWQVEGDPDVSIPHRIDLPSGRSIVVFLYQQELSMRVSFDPGATVNADRFLTDILLSKYRPYRRKTDSDQLLMIASDGELYGHHQPFRDKFLAHLTNGALADKNVELTYPGLYLRDHAVDGTVKLRENTSWSCHHGILRWSGECGCAPHGEWKAPLRMALEQIAEVVDEQFLLALKGLTDTPWELRHDYIRVMNGEVEIDDFLRQHLGDSIGTGKIEQIDALLRAQVERQRMFTSCGWFFDDFDRIEPRNNVAYAAQAVWLTLQACEIDLSDAARAWLKPVKSWRSGLCADMVFDRCLERAREHSPITMW